MYTAKLLLADISPNRFHTNTLKLSFTPKEIRDWNALPDNVVTCGALDAFVSGYQAWTVTERCHRQLSIVPVSLSFLCACGCVCVFQAVLPSSSLSPVMTVGSQNAISYNIESGSVVTFLHRCKRGVLCYCFDVTV